MDARIAISGWVPLATSLLSLISGSAGPLDFGPTEAVAAYGSFDPNGSGYHYPPEANGLASERPALDAHRLTGTLKLDGQLDDAAWSEVPAGYGFVEADPNRGEPASEQTLFKVLYDEDAIYFGVACYENDMANVSTALSRRDRVTNSDVISIYIDPYHDRTTGYNFRVNPHGVKMDQYVFNDGDRDLDWDAVWEVETHRDDQGWYAEFRIPFSSIRYRPQPNMTWGLQVYRWMHGRGEDTAWVNWDRNVQGFVSRFGELRNLRDVRSPRQLEITPYVVQRATDPSVEGEGDTWDGFQNFGADVKYGLTADLTLNATFQPDFGQVEADPSVLNLSPFETFFAEKRPFFIEGSRFFEHPHFNLVYTRRIGTGSELARIRYAGKLIGKTAGDVSVATLFAATDLAGNGKAHNFLRSGSNREYFAVTRLGKEFSGGDHNLNIMGTAVLRDGSLRETIDDNNRDSRDGYSAGADFMARFRERAYQVQGSYVTTIVDPAPVANDATIDHSSTRGFGARLEMQKLAGKYRGGLFGGWESTELDPNDMGILFAPDEVTASLWLQRRFNTEDPEAYLINGNLNINAHRSWFDGQRTAFSRDDDTQEIWRYGNRKPQNAGGNINGWVENRHRWSTNYGVWHDFERRDKFNTRRFNGARGPLMVLPARTGFWWGVNSDWRKSFGAEVEIEADWDRAGSRVWNPELDLRWVQNSRLNHSLSFGYTSRHDNAQFLTNLDDPGQGIDGVSYLFGELDAKVWDVTLRSNILFSRDKSLELYLQPFLSTQDYYQPRFLANPDSYDLEPYTDNRSDAFLASIDASRFDVQSFDRRFGAVNLNMVYRWEYRPGSTLFLVWTHSRSRFEDRRSFGNPDDFDPGFSSDSLFRNEPENRFLAKFTYWFAL